MMNEVIKIVEGRGDSFLDDSKYSGEAYDKLRSFYERLYDLETEVDYEEDAVKKMFLQLELEKMENCIKVFCGKHVLFALRSGLNVHVEFHIYPSPTMYVCFELTEQKREKSVVTWARFQDNWYVIDGQSYLVTSWSGCFSRYEEYSNVMDMTKYPNYIFDEDALKASGVPIPEAFHVDFKIGETKLISIVDKPTDVMDCSGYQMLRDYSDYTEDWFNRFFVFWYIRTFAVCA